MTEVEIHLPFVPPSMNKAYRDIVIRTPKGMRASRKLTTEGQSFKRKCSAYISTRYTSEIQELAQACEDPNVVLVVALRTYFEALVNSTWPKGTDVRFKKVDADNRGKLTYDAFTSSLASIDDSRFFLTCQEKFQRCPEGARLVVSTVSCAKFGIPEV